MKTVILDKLRQLHDGEQKLIEACERKQKEIEERIVQEIFKLIATDEEVRSKISFVLRNDLSKCKFYLEIEQTEALYDDIIKFYPCWSTHHFEFDLEDDVKMQANDGEYQIVFPTGTIKEIKMFCSKYGVKLTPPKYFTVEEKTNQMKDAVYELGIAKQIEQTIKEVNG